MHLNFSTALALAILLSALTIPVLADEAGKTQPAATAVQTKDAASTQPDKTDTVGAAQRAAQPNATTAVPPPSGPPELHRVRMRLSGSMCMACLHTLEGKLKQLPGVDDARIRRTQANYFQPIAPELSTWADAIFIYDEKRLSLNDLRYSIKQNGYHSYQVSDKYLDHAPQERDLKL